MTIHFPSSSPCTLGSIIRSTPICFCLAWSHKNNKINSVSKVQLENKFWNHVRINSTEKQRNLSKSIIHSVIRIRRKSNEGTCLVNKGLSDILDVPRGSTSSKYHEISPIVVLGSWNNLDVVSLNVCQNLLDLLQIEDATVKGGGG